MPGVIDTQHPKVMASWWPADVALPVADGELPRSLRRCRVYVTESELVVFTAPDVESFRSVVDFVRTSQPPELDWPRQPLDFHTEAGLVVVQPTGGCGCGNPLKRWQPDWASHRTPWRTP